MKDTILSILFLLFVFGTIIAGSIGISMVFMSMFSEENMIRMHNNSEAQR